MNYIKNSLITLINVWIPDFEDSKNSLSGKLSNLKTNSSNYFYIGALSRFEYPSTNKKTEYKFTAIISGPEPQRSIFEEKIKQLFKSKNDKCAIIGGLPLSDKVETTANIDYYPHLSSSQFLELITISENIICRPGYSSIMDLSILQKPVYFIPTPGQTEQEYLANYYSKKYNIGSSTQKDLLKSKQVFNYLPFINNPILTSTLKYNLKLIN